MPQPATEYFPQSISGNRPRIWWLVLTFGVLLFVSLIIAAPFLAASGHTASATNIYHAFGFLCHQRPERSFFIDGHKLAVCSRCTGLYFGAALTLVFYPLLRSLRSTHPPHRRWLILAAIPIFVDFLLTFVGVWENTHTTRFVTGTLLGSVTVFYVMPGVVELSLRSWQRQVSSQPEVLANSIPVGPSDYSAPDRRI